MPIDYSNPQVLNFFIENYEREQEKRLFWFYKHKNEILRAAQLPENYKDLRTEDVKRVSLETYMPVFAEDYRNSMVNHRKKDNLDQPAYSPSPVQSTPKPVMLPIEPTTEGIRYQALPFGGRTQYLKARNHKKPEEKYYFDQTSSQVYGWGLKESKIVCVGSVHGRYSSFTREMNSRPGLHPDPSHYQKPAKNPYSKCAS